MALRKGVVGPLPEAQQCLGTEAVSQQNTATNIFTNETSRSPFHKTTFTQTVNNIAEHPAQDNPSWIRVQTTICETKTSHELASWPPATTEPLSTFSCETLSKPFLCGDDECDELKSDDSIYLGLE